MSTAVGRERGSVLIIAVIAMLVMGVLSVSFALLASLETKIGVNHTLQLQARALADAAFAYGKDFVAGAVTTDFDTWLNTAVAGSSATNGRDLAPGQYWARVDNDCDTIADESGTAGTAQLVPAAIRESPTCNNTDDTNQTAVITAWAEVGSGQSVARSRVRAIVGVDNPWRHVCATQTAESTCTDPVNQAGNPTIQPADTGHPNGPKTYPVMPHPTLGCSAIDPTMHGNDAGCTLSRKVMVGVAGDPRNCNGGDQAYAGYFDCALTTPCGPPDYCAPGGVRYTHACVLPGDTRANTLVGGVGPHGYAETVGGRCPATATIGGSTLPVTGMVYNYLDPVPALGRDATAMNIDMVVEGDIGAPGAGRTVYVLRGTTEGQAEIRHGGGPDKTFYGTWVVEGDGPPEDCPGAGSDFAARSQTAIRTVNGTYGYPLVLLLYDPQQPTPLPRQAICADLGAGGGNTQVEGIVYSAGKVEFNPLTLNGGVVSYDAETQGSAVYTYNNTFGSAAPPPGFPVASGASLAIIRKSYIVCSNYSVNSSGTDFPAPSRCD
jgi:Tfp pilus assembly protein PilX